MKMKKVLLILLGISVFLSFFVFLRSTDISESVRLINQLGFNVIFIFFTTFSAYLFGALGWKYCIDTDTRPPLIQLFVFRHIGNTITLFNPTNAIAGELFNANMLIRQGITDRIAYKSVLLSRIVMTLSQLSIFLIALIWFLFTLSDTLSKAVRYSLYICFILFVLAIVLFLFFLFSEDKKTCPAPLALEKRWNKLLFHIKEMRLSLAEYIYRRPKEVSIAFVAFTFQWILSSLELYFILYFLGYGVNVWDGLFMDTVIIMLKSTVSFIPGQLGAEELINKFVLFLVGINSPNLWLSVSILRRARQLFWSGIALFFYIGLKRSKKLENRGSIVREP